MRIAGQKSGTTAREKKLIKIKRGEKDSKENRKRKDHPPPRSRVRTIS